MSTIFNFNKSRMVKELYMNPRPLYLFLIEANISLIENGKWCTLSVGVVSTTGFDKIIGTSSVLIEATSSLFFTASVFHFDFIY